MTQYITLAITNRIRQWLMPWALTNGFGVFIPLVVNGNRVCSRETLYICYPLSIQVITCPKEILSPIFMDRSVMSSMRILRIQIPMMKWTTVTANPDIILRNERITRQFIEFYCYWWNGLGFIHILWMGWKDFQWALLMDPNLSDGYRIHICSLFRLIYRFLKFLGWKNQFHFHKLHHITLRAYASVAVIIHFDFYFYFFLHLSPHSISQ